MPWITLRDWWGNKKLIEFSREDCIGWRFPAIRTDAKAGSKVSMRKETIRTLILKQFFRGLSENYLTLKWVALYLFSSKQKKNSIANFKRDLRRLRFEEINFFHLLCPKLRGLGIPNQMVNNSKSDSNGLGHQFN